MGRDTYSFVSATARAGGPAFAGEALQPVSRLEAAHVLDRVAREQPALLLRLYVGFVSVGSGPALTTLPQHQLLARLKAALASGPAEAASLCLARLRVLKRERRNFVPAPAPAPPRPPRGARQVREAHYVAVLVKSRSGRPIADVACELRFADDSRLIVHTDPLGIASAQSVPAGPCRIRLLAHDLSSWDPVGGAPARSVGRGPARIHQIRPGEHLMRVCLRHGITDWKSVWSDSANTALRARRRSPHVLHEGDSLVLPGLEIGEIERCIDATHAVRLDCELAQTVRVRLRDFARAGLDGLEYELSYEHAGKRVQRAGAAATDREGTLREQLPLEVENLVLVFKRPKLVLALRLGELDPAQDADLKTPIASGADARLCGLGYAAALGEVDTRVIARFQAEELGRAEPSGELDGETCSRLEALYGT